MDCRTFRQHHCAFVDDILPGADAAVMEDHRAACGRCAEYDARVRRSLLVIRNLPAVQCSPDFAERLQRRLRETGVDRHPTITVRPRPALGTFAAVAATLVVFAGAALAFASLAEAPALRMPPVVASAPPPPVPDRLAGPALAASASAAAPMWPALLLADELPMHVAESGFHTVGLAY